MKPRQPRVPVRWGPVLMMGAVVAGLMYAGFHFATQAAESNPEYWKSTVAFFKSLVL